MRTALPHIVSSSEIEEIRSALERYDRLNNFFDGPDEPPCLTELGKAVRHAWQTYQHAKGGVLARSLPNLLRQAQAAEAAYQGTGQAGESAGLLGQVYQITSSALRNLASSSWPGSPPIGRWRRRSAPTTPCWPGWPTSAWGWPCSPWGGPAPRWRST